MTKRIARRTSAGIMLAVAALFAALVPAGAQAQVECPTEGPPDAVYGTDIPTRAIDECLTPPDAQIGALPFTGLDLLILAGIALVLTGTGFALRRLSTPKGPAA